MFEMKLINKFIVMLTIATATATNKGITPGTTAESAKMRFYNDFIINLYKSIGETQVNNMHVMLKVFSHSTVEQAQQVVNYIEEHSNLTRAEGHTLRMAANASIETTDCILKKEIDLIQAFRHTGYNLHNCIRTAQMNYEKAYVELSNKLDALKAKTVAAYRNYSNMINNCIDSECNMRTLLQSVVKFESLKEELELEVTEANNLSSRYIITSIAMGCVSSSLQQIHHNYNLGKDLMARCFHAKQSEQSGSEGVQNQRYQQQHHGQRG